MSHNEDTVSYLSIVCFVSVNYGICYALQSDQKVMKEDIKILCDVIGSCSEVHLLLPMTRLLWMKAFSSVFGRPRPEARRL